MEIIAELNELKQVVTEQILPQLPAQGLVFVKGEMGTGKTTLVSEIASHWGFQDITASPTFGLVNVYQNEKKHIFHLDLYRLNDAEEIWDIGWEDISSSNALIFVEWPNFLEDIGEEADLVIQIENVGVNKRQYILK